MDSSQELKKGLLAAVMSFNKLWAGSDFGLDFSPHVFQYKSQMTPLKSATLHQCKCDEIVCTVEPIGYVLSVGGKSGNIFPLGRKMG